MEKNDEIPVHEAPCRAEAQRAVEADQRAVQGTGRQEVKIWRMDEAGGGHGKGKGHPLVAPRDAPAKSGRDAEADR